LRRVELGQIAEVFGGYAFKSKDFNENSGVPVIKISNIQGGEVSERTLKEYLPDSYLYDYENYQIRRGDILVALSGATTGKTGVYNLDRKSLLNQRVGLVRAKDGKSEQKYLSYYVSKITDDILNKAQGVAQPNISTKELAKFEIPLPTLSEQKAIVAKLDHAQRFIDIDREMLAKYDELIQSVFLEMFGDPVRNKKGWEVKKGKTLFNFKSGKYLKKELLDESFEYPVYGGNGVRGYYDDFLVDYPTLIIGRVGAKCGVIHSIKEESWITDNAIFLEDFAYPNKINFYYILLKLLNINQYADYSGQPKITQKPLKNLDIIHPKEDLVLQFEKVYAQIVSEKKKLDGSLKKSEELFSSLVQGVFG